LRHAYHVEHASTIFAPDASGSLRPVKANSEEGRNAKPLLPWGDDKDRLVEALAGHMRKRGKKWVQSKARGSHGYETYTPDWEWSLATRNATGEDIEYGGPIQAAKDRLTREDHPR
jgi:hypothetical protein